MAISIEVKYDGMTVFEETGSFLGIAIKRRITSQHAVLTVWNGEKKLFSVSAFLPVLVPNSRSPSIDILENNTGRSDEELREWLLALDSHLKKHPRMEYLADILEQELPAFLEAGVHESETG